MGLFGKSKAELLRWQNVLMQDSPHRLIMTEQQLKVATFQPAQRNLQAIGDCKRLVETTTKPDVFFSRLQMLMERSRHLCILEPYMDFTGVTPTVAYNEACRNYQMAIYQFLVRYYIDTLNRARAMKTTRGKLGKFRSFYDSLQVYYPNMNEMNKRYIEEKFMESLALIDEE